MSSSRTDSAVAVVMPQMGVSVAEGTIVEWRKQVGETVARDETICEVTTDKIDVEIPAPVAGRVVEILAHVGETVPVGATIAHVEAAGGAPDEAARAPSDADMPAAVDRSRRYSPVVARIAAQHQLDLTQVKGTGRGGRVTKQDALAAVAALGNGSALHTDSPYRPEQDASAAVNVAPERSGGSSDEVVPLSRMRQSIAEHMVASLRTAATCTTVVEIDMSAVEAAQAPLGVSYLPFVARAAIDALRVFPTLNSTFEGDALVRHQDVNLGIAVSLDEDGLIVPVIRRAHELSVEGLARGIGEVARRARARELTPDDVHGGTFTITNPGAFGAIIGTPIINQPQVAILDLEAVVRRPVVIGDAIAIRPVAYLCMSWDHRVLDGALAAKFLGAVRAKLEAV